MSATYYLTRLRAKDISVILGKALQQHLNCFDQRNVHIQSGLRGLGERARPAATVVGHRNANVKSHICKHCSENGLRGDGGSRGCAERVGSSDNQDVKATLGHADGRILATSGASAVRQSLRKHQDK